ncbi:hypothetical protein F383_24834 [Gossypium arboreum]|uniref:Uncharacterized protein n=1 Tax=Gossypium arboreum TaxID=29729 RepID=A0A0B0NZS0_GOSAR|nr:hypothetical protein F383_24834 [Gossypium arboreum]
MYTAVTHCWVEFENKSVCSTRPHTRACNLAVWHKSVYATGHTG